MKKLSSALFLLFFAGIYTNAQVTKSNTTPGSVNGFQDSRDITFTAIDLGGCTSMSDVNVSINWEGGTDPIMEDFAMRITSPAGTSVDLVYDIWGAFDPSAPNSTYENPSMDDFGPLTTTFDDEAASPAEGTVVPATGSWQPQEPLSAFDGEDGTGTWTIEFSDDLDNGWGDEILWTQIDITIDCTPPCTDPDVPTVTAGSTTICTGGNTTLDWSGANLNNATNWHIYTTSCGTGLLTSQPGTSLVVSPASTTTYYIRGEDGAGCVDESTGLCGSITITVNPLDDASFSYSAAAYCVDDTDPTPTITGLGGGTFSSTAGLSITPSTGAIDVSASTPGTYTVTYTTAGSCPNSSNVAVTINALDDASFSYSAATYCVDDTDPTPTITGLGGGSFSSTAGLSITPATGAIDVSASTPGTYTVTYTTAGTCPNSSNVAVTINALDDASFSYSAAAYCVDDTDPTPTITGLGGGSFSSTAGLSITPATGAIDVSASTPGTYTVTYTTAGTCPNSSNVAVTINALDDASFSYSAAAYCVDDTDPTPTITGLGGGSFSSTAGLSITPATGAIDVSASTPGTYTVTYTTAGSCPNSSNVAVTINALDDASFSYSAASYCVDASDPTPTVTGLGGGTFSSTAGLSITPSTGAIDVSASTPGTYTVTYTTAGTCPNSSNVAVTINALDDASFSYSASTYCPNATDPTPTITGLTGGTFSSTAGLSITPSTGEIDISASTNGTYTVTYTTSGSCPNSSNVAITIEDVTDPVITCPGNQTENADASCQVTLPDYTSLVTVTDNCDPSPSVVQSPAAGTIISSTTTITMTATDATGNSSNCTFDVTINDATAPTAACQNITVYLDASGNASITAADIDGGSTDNCGAVTLSASTTSFTCADIGANNVTLTVEDGNTNTATCVAVVTVADTTSPTVVCQNINAYLDGTGNATITAADIDGGSTDNCGSPTLSASLTAFTCANIGANSVTLTATDGSSNSSNCVSTVTVLDTISPTTSCQNITVYLDGAGTASIVAADIDAGSSDNCGSVTLSASSTTFGCGNVGPNNVTLTSTDASGNTSSCTAVVTVLDTIAPLANCQNITAYLNASGNVNINANDVNNGSVDNCSGMSYILSQTLFTCADIGANNVDFTVTDPSGNAAMCSTVVTIADSTSPALACPTDQSSCDTTLADYTGSAISTDNCGTPTITQSPVAGTILSPGIHIITITSTDGSGNSSSCTFNLTINPIYNEVDSASICSGDSYTFGTQTLTTGGTYTEVFTSVSGCDSTVVLTLTEYPVYNETATASMCVGSTYQFGTQSLTTAGTYTEVFTSISGCDSTVVLTLTVTTSVNYTDSATICQGDTYSFGTQLLDSTGVYTEVFPLPSGCDSIVTLTLTVGQEYNTSITHTMCEGDSYQFGGQTLTQSGNYGTIYQSIHGCDSTVNLMLIIGAENVDVIQDGPELTADNANATYQWVDCDNNFQPILGDTNQVFVATANGNYAVIIYEGGCSDTSACYNVNNVNVVELLLENHIKLYPNPARNQFTIELDGTIQDIEFNMYDISGKQLFNEQQILSNTTRINVSHYERGVYFAEFRHGEKRQVIKLIVE